MEDLHLPQLSQALRRALFPNPSPSKKMKRATPRIPKQSSVYERRPSRVANKPAPDYRDGVNHKLIDVGRRETHKIYKRRDLSNRVYASDETREWAISKAEELGSGLGADYPTLVKPITQSHVSRGFWLGLPARFCRRNLPKREEFVTPVDEEGQEFRTVYLARKAGLSGGWKRFAVDHELEDGGALVVVFLINQAYSIQGVHYKAK